MRIIWFLGEQSCRIQHLLLEKLDVCALSGALKNCEDDDDDDNRSHIYVFVVANLTEIMLVSRGDLISYVDIKLGQGSWRGCEISAMFQTLL